jgi:glycylpeptide N-tetradecanoyltransferase
MNVHKFWESEPIMLYRHKLKEGEIKQIKPTDVPQEPTPLPQGFEWANFDVKNDEEVDEICKFLEDHYVEDALGNFKVSYSREKFRWAVQTHYYTPELHILIRNSQNKKIMAIATGDPKKFVINGKVVKMVEGNFMCVHSKLREKRLAMILF